MKKIVSLLCAIVSIVSLNSIHMNAISDTDFKLYFVPSKYSIDIPDNYDSSIKLYGEYTVDHGALIVDENNTLRPRCIPSFDYIDGEYVRNDLYQEGTFEIQDEHGNTYLVEVENYFEVYAREKINNIINMSTKFDNNYEALEFLAETVVNKEHSDYRITVEDYLAGDLSGDNITAIESFKHLCCIRGWEFYYNTSPCKNRKNSCNVIIDDDEYTVVLDNEKHQYRIHSNSDKNKKSIISDLFYSPVDKLVPEPLINTVK